MLMMGNDPAMQPAISSHHRFFFKLLESWDKCRYNMEDMSKNKRYCVTYKKVCLLE